MERVPESAAGWRQVIAATNASVVHNFDELRAAFPVQCRASDHRRGPDLHDHPQFDPRRKPEPSARPRSWRGLRLLRRRGRHRGSHPHGVSREDQGHLDRLPDAAGASVPGGALEDAVAVWREVIKTLKPQNCGLLGSFGRWRADAGDGAQAERTEGAVAGGSLFAGTPWSDLTKAGDTQFTNADIDDVLVTSDGLLGACARLYVGMHDLKHPLVSPVYGDLSGFPPTILVSGTRDLLLSDTVRVHRKLCQAGVDARLHVFEGLSHAQYLQSVPDAGMPRRLRAGLVVLRRASGQVTETSIPSIPEP